MPKKKGRVVQQEISVSYRYTRRIQLEEKRCPQCGKRFEGQKVKEYCSPACKRRAHYQRYADAYRAKRVDRYHSQKKQAAKKRGK